MNKVAIHGFGRIGRIATRIALRDALFTPVAVSDIQDLATLGALITTAEHTGLEA